MLGRVDVGHAAMVPLEVQPAGRDHALERLQRRARGAAARRAGLRADERARHLAFVLGGAAVLAHPAHRGLSSTAGLPAARPRRRVSHPPATRPLAASKPGALLDESTLGCVHRTPPVGALPFLHEVRMLAPGLRLVTAQRCRPARSRVRKWVRRPRRRRCGTLSRHDTPSGHSRRRVRRRPHVARDGLRAAHRVPGVARPRSHARRLSPTPSGARASVSMPSGPAQATRERTGEGRYVRYLAEYLGITDDAERSAIAEWRRGFNVPIGLCHQADGEAAKALQQRARPGTHRWSHLELQRLGAASARR